MYFSNIANEELVKFHNLTKNNIAISLSDIISGNALFKLETIITNKVYKIYPLFYCENIKSTNQNDKILSNKCVICENKDDTILSFTSNTDNPVTNLYCTYNSIISGKSYCGCVYDNRLNVLENVEVSIGKTKTYTNAMGLFYIYSTTSGTLKLKYNDLELIP